MHPGSCPGKRGKPQARIRHQAQGGHESLQLKDDPAPAIVEGPLPGRVQVGIQQQPPFRLSRAGADGGEIDALSPGKEGVQGLTIEKKVGSHHQHGPHAEEHRQPGLPEKAETAKQLRDQRPGKTAVESPGMERKGFHAHVGTARPAQLPGKGLGGPALPLAPRRPGGQLPADPSDPLHDLSRYTLDPVVPFVHKLSSAVFLLFCPKCATTWDPFPGRELFSLSVV